jgi:hypothetical protein
LQWLLARKQIKQTPSRRQVKWPRFNHTRIPFNAHAHRRARAHGAERDKPWQPGENTPGSTTNFCIQRHRMIEMNRRNILKNAAFSGDGP